MATPKAPAKKRHYFGPGKKRPPKKKIVAQSIRARAYQLGQDALALAIQRYLDGLDATKPIFRKEDDGEGNHAYVPQEDVPDHAIRLKAADSICDRFGIPKKVEADSNDPFSGFLTAVAAAMKETTDA